MAPIAQIVSDSGLPVLIAGAAIRVNLGTFGCVWTAGVAAAQTPQTLGEDQAAEGGFARIAGKTMPSRPRMVATANAR
jgi:hypothetical protein